jgi:molybdenum cofactor cytidylyltransferase
MRCAAIVLAAGRSSRMGGPNKLLELLRGKPLLEHVLSAARESRADPIIVVAGHQAEEVGRIAAGFSSRTAFNPRFAEGLSTSLRAGIDSVPAECGAAVIMLGDMPDVSAEVIDRMVAALEARPEAPAVVPSFHGAWGNPVVLARSVFPDVARLSGDAGARKLLEGLRERVVVVPVEDPAVTLDLDTPEALALARRSAGDASGT